MKQGVIKVKDSSILKYDKLKKMLNKVKEYIDKKEYKEAYFKAASLIEYININVLIRKFNVRLEDTSITNIIKEYAKKDETLYEIMIGINAEYNAIDIDKVDLSDIEYLVEEADYITEYVTEKYGNLFE